MRSLNCEICDKKKKLNSEVKSCNYQLLFVYYSVIETKKLNSENYETKVRILSLHLAILFLRKRVYILQLESKVQIVR